MKDRIIIAITGATGIIYGIRLLEELRKLDDVELLLILSDWAKHIILEETSFSVEDVESLGHKVYSNQDLAAPIASGSYQIKSMIVAPCSMKTLAGISSGFSNSLILRAADVSLKEHRKLVLVPRETPLNQV
ncbi:UbiX family flavin prenyltransferase, partial [bacterium]|nr:UbiX family flavin prenyltransferase [bacterium]